MVCTKRGWGAFASEMTQRNTLLMECCTGNELPECPAETTRICNVALGLNGSHEGYCASAVKIIQRALAVHWQRAPEHSLLCCVEERSFRQISSIAIKQSHGSLELSAVHGTWHVIVMDRY